MVKRSYFFKLRKRQKGQGRDYSVAIRGAGGVPAFNNDSRCYMPMFFLSCEAEELEAREDVQKQTHEQRLREQQEEQEDILIPQPRRKHKFCSVCHLRYEDYRTHIGMLSHHQKLSKSRVEPYLQELAAAILHPKPDEDHETYFHDSSPPSH
jgi:hypothetical protein